MKEDIKNQPTPKEKFDQFFSSLKLKVAGMLKPPSADALKEYDFPDNLLERHPFLMNNMYGLIDAAGANIHNPGVKYVVGQELLKWLAEKRPDIINDMILNK